MENKKCTRCHKIKSLNNFNKRKGSKDGHRSDCQTCQRRINLEYYYKNHAKCKLVSRRYNENNKDKKKKFRDSYKKKFPEKVKAIMSIATKKWADKNPEKRKAYSEVYCAMKCGKIIKESCSKCGGNNDVMAHHEDYTKPLEILWLCRLCHIVEHKRLRYQRQYRNAYNQLGG